MLLRDHLLKNNWNNLNILHVSWVVFVGTVLLLQFQLKSTISLIRAGSTLVTLGSHYKMNASVVKTLLEYCLEKPPEGA